MLPDIADIDNATVIISERLYDELRGSVRFSKRKNAWLIKRIDGAWENVPTGIVSGIVQDFIAEEFPDATNSKAENEIVELLKIKRDILIDRIFPVKSYLDAQKYCVRCCNCQFLIGKPFSCSVSGEGSRYDFDPRRLLKTRTCRDFQPAPLASES